MKNEITTGTILISKPFMEDKRFEKTVILITEHNENGTVGFVLNRKTAIDILDFTTSLTKKTVTIKQGGPVDNNSLFFIHKHPDLINNCIKIKDGYFWGGDMSDVIEGMNRDEIKAKEILFFTGYSGWEKNQLKEEVNEGSWIIHNTHLDILEGPLNWSTLLIEINKEFEVWTTAPSDFRLN
tara:strand:+ start:313 stop:858 length:546 start_codon:yes stop_codon:yes gene_type:complete